MIKLNRRIDRWTNEPPIYQSRPTSDMVLKKQAETLLRLDFIFAEKA